MCFTRIAFMEACCAKQENKNKNLIRKKIQIMSINNV